ncbi:MAG: hypothetical protein MK160_07925 [Rhodobacteraceae bacterium]|nr:hypothetical protein [Paracoccaceae bacterium]
MFAKDTVSLDLEAMRSFLKAERAKTLSEAEWRFRMRGYGYQVRRVEGGIEVAKLPTKTIVATFAM